MIFTSRKINLLLLLCVVIAGAATPLLLRAQQSQSLSVTPPLIQLSAAPEQAWRSSVKVINTNDYPLTVYLDPVNFAPVGEVGHGRFLPILEEETEGKTLAEWIHLDQTSVVIPAEQSADVHFTVNVPEDASPGGHFAAILVGTRPPDGVGTMAVRTSQVVSTLFFISIDGDVIEKGSIREFSVDRSFTETPAASFLVRFENKGNVHVRPEGEIRIFNMWGKERGHIPINQSSQFGNVLPGTIRKFQFSWTGEPNLTDIGRYKAELALLYGANGKQTVTGTVTFWVIPVKFALISLIVIVTLIMLIRFAIKSYVRHMLMMAGIDPDERERERSSGSVVMTKRLQRRAVVVEDDDEDEDEEDDEEDDEESKGGLISFIKKYFFFFVGIPSALALLVLAIWYVSGALTAERGFEATIHEGEVETTINSEELKLAEQTEVVTEQTATRTQPFDLHIVNVSGEPGVAASVALKLGESDFVVDAVEPDLNRVEKNTVIITSEGSVEAAQSLSKILDNALVSFSDESKATSTTPLITIFTGQDQIE